MYLEHLYIATRTRNVADAGTSDEINLVINGSLKAISIKRSKGKVGLAKVDIADLQLLPEEINYSMATTGSNLWMLNHATVWGQRIDSGNIYPIGFGEVQGLSKDAGEGVSSITPPLVFLGQETTIIRRLLILIYTHPAAGFPKLADFSEKAGTNSNVNLQIGTTSGLVVDYDLPETSQSDLEKFAANYYIAPVASPFTHQQLMDESIILSIRGSDSWFPNFIAIFGVNTSNGEAQRLVPLVHLVPSFGAMSTDPDEGVEFAHLPLAPIDDTSILPPFDGGLVAVRQLYTRIHELEKRLIQYENC